jgi:hypothetical protein
MTSALEPDELTADRLALNLGESASATYLFNPFGELLDGEPCFLPGSPNDSAMVAPNDRR